MSREGEIDSAVESMGLSCLPPRRSENPEGVAEAEEQEEVKQDTPLGWRPGPA